MRNKLRNSLVFTAITLPVAVMASEQPHSFAAELNAIGNFNNDDASWLDRGYGRYSVGEEGDSLHGLAELQLGYKYQLSDSWSLQTHLQGQVSSQSNSARHLGVVELKAKYANDLDWNQRIELTFGQFFLPISMENTDRFWESPYTITFSSLNSWIGEEFRPIGIDASYEYLFNNGDRLSFAATLFGGNDSMGALLAYRGWSYGRHRTVFDDVVSTPDLSSLANGGTFADQRDDGSKPFGRELDNKPGYALRTSYSSENYLINLTWVDNQGNTELHHGEYAWRTKFAILGASWFVTDELELLAEASTGNTTMGEAPGVDADFYSAYVMASYLKDEFRYTARYDAFGMDDKDRIDNDNNDFGRSYTLAVMWQPEESAWSGGVEAMYLHSKRQKMTTSGIYNDSDSHSLSLLVSYRI